MYSKSFNNLTYRIIYSQKVNGDMSLLEGEDNRKKFCKDFLNVPAVSAKQVHSSKIKIVDSKFLENRALSEADALITKMKNVGLANGMGDCPIVTIMDPMAEAVANVHSGREGIILKVVPKTVAVMERINVGAKKRNIHVLIGPCICKNCYMVSEKDAHKWGFFGAYPKHIYPVTDIRENPGKCLIDLRGIIVQQLVEEAGIMEENIEHVDVCTFEDLNYFSYRRAIVNGKNHLASRQKEKSTQRGVCVVAMKVA